MTSIGCLESRPNAGLEEDLRREYPSATIHREKGAFADWVRALVAHLDGRMPKLDLPIDVKAKAEELALWGRWETAWTNSVPT